MKKIRSSVVFLLVFSYSFLHAEDSVAPVYKIKAVFLFNFTQFVDWPTSSFTSGDSPFIIGIAGNNPFGNYIEATVEKEKVNDHPIVVQYFSTEKEIPNCHILFINSSNEKTVKEIISATSSRNTLTVGEVPSFNKLGGMIRFYTEQGKLRLEINTDAARLAQLNISSKLLSVAKTN